MVRSCCYSLRFSFQIVEAEVEIKAVAVATQQHKQKQQQYCQANNRQRRKQATSWAEFGAHEANDILMTEEKKKETQTYTST